MPEELAFARKASGLVRGLSFWDTFGIGLAVIQPIYAIWYSMQVGVGLFRGGNLLIATLDLGGHLRPLRAGGLGHPGRLDAQVWR